MENTETSNSILDSATKSASRKNSSGTRRMVGVLLLLLAVFSWTTSNFLASYLFIVDTYSKPFLVTYVNSAALALLLVPRTLVTLYRQCNATHGSRLGYSVLGDRESSTAVPEEDGIDIQPYSGLQPAAIEEQYAIPCLAKVQPIHSSPVAIVELLGVRDTFVVAFQLCFLWFLGNYSVVACLAHTTVSSATVIASTEGLWVMLYGYLYSVEHFPSTKLIGTLTLIGGVAVVSFLDVSQTQEQQNPNYIFYPSPEQMAIGDLMAAFAAICHAFYTVFMKWKLHDVARVDMRLMFGLLGANNMILFWPGFVILHVLGWELFSLPSSSEVWAAIIVNAAISIIGDLCWASAMLLTSPLVATVGMSLKIPMSLIGQIFLQSRHASASYWIGAALVCLSFVFVNHQEQDASDRL